MKNKLLIGIIFCAITISIYAQDKHKKPDYGKFKAEKIAYITEAIELTPVEAQNFWPIYNEYEKKKWAIISERRDLEKELSNGIQEMTDKEYIDLSKKFTSYHLIEGNIRKEYNDKFLKILPAKKVVDLYIAEVQFRGFLLRKYRDDKHRNGGNDKSKQ